MKLLRLLISKDLLPPEADFVCRQKRLQEASREPFRVCRNVIAKALENLQVLGYLTTYCRIRSPRCKYIEMNDYV